MACQSQIGAQSDAGAGLGAPVDVDGGLKCISPPAPAIGWTGLGLTALGNPRQMLTHVFG